MKKLIKILLSLYILFLIPSASIAQQGIQQKQFPQIPEHPVKRPAPQQHLGYLEFQNEHPDWSVHWSIKSGVPRSIPWAAHIDGRRTSGSDRTEIPQSKQDNI